jgi:Family of unknown function (DUF5343)
MSDSFMPLRGKSPRKHPTPPYISFLRLKAFIQSLQQAGVPERLDPDFFDSLPTGDRRQLQTALQYLQLIDAYWRPTSHLPALVEAYGDERWSTELSELLRRAYRPLLESSLALATQEELADAFGEIYDGTDDVLRKSRTFFLHAAHEANIDLDPAIFNGIKPRVSHTRRPRTEVVKNPNRRDEPWTGYSPARPQRDMSPLAALQPTSVLLELWDNDDMSPEEVKAIQILLKYCKRKLL